MRFKVLLIDDEPGALEGMQLWIPWEELGFEICGTCGNGAEGIKMMAELAPDLVVTDVNMPLMDGLEMIEEWQKHGNKKISFMIVSGYSEFEYARKAMRQGITHYLLKPVEAEEAGRELRAVYGELLQESEEQRYREMASREELVSRIRDLLEERQISDSESAKLEALSAGRKAWNICLVETEPAMYAELRRIAETVISEDEAMFLVDLEANRFGVVYGCSAEDRGEDRAIGRLAELSAQCAGHRVFMASGKGETSLFRISACYRTAAEAIVHKFYDPDYAGVISYNEVLERKLEYHFDQIRLMDRLIETMDLLDAPGFSEAVTDAAREFREMPLARETVKKIVIHLMYKMKDYMKEACGESANALLDKYEISAISDAVMILDDLMKLLLSFGRECIEELSEDQARKSQGVVQKINDYIREHYREGLTIKKLAEVFYLHPVYLGQLLMKKNGVGFNELVHNLRIEEAVRLLRQSKYKNSEIAERVGYVNYSQFLKQFEKRLGMSPNEYKNRN